MTLGKSKYLAIAMVFFIIGFFSTFLEAYLPWLRETYHLKYWQMGLLDFAFFMTYVLSVWLERFCVGRFCAKRRLLYGLVVVLLGTIGWAWVVNLPTTSSWVLLVMTFVIALGVVMIFIIAEPLALFLSGEAKPARLSMFQAGDGIGAFVAPLLATVLLTGLAFGSLVPGYDFFAVAIIAVLGLIIYLLALPSGAFDAAQLDHSSASARLPARAYGYVLALFLYVGVEVSLGSYMVNQGLEHYHLPLAITRWSLSAYWFLIIVGRVLGGWFLNHCAPHKALMGSSLMGIALLVLALLFSGLPGFVLLVLTGLANAMMFPLIFALALMAYPQLKSRMSAVLATALCGGALVPLLVGAGADQYGLTGALLMLLVGYIGIVLLQFFVFIQPAGPA